MALNKRERKKRPVIADKTSDPTQIIADKINVIETDEIDFNRLENVTAADRKTLKVDPDIKYLIEIFSNFEGLKEYEMTKEIVEFYYKHNYDERARRIIGINFNNDYRR